MARQVHGTRVLWHDRAADLTIREGADGHATQTVGPAFRARYRRRIGAAIPLTIRRANKDLTVTLTVPAELRVDGRLEFDRRPSLKSARIRHAILSGTTDRP